VSDSVTPVPALGPGLQNRVRSAVFWRSGSQILSQIVTWTATIIVVRLLDPHDYGLFAMSQSVLVALNFLNGHSFASSLIQQDEVDRRKIAQVFGLLLLFNIVLASAQMLIAPWVAAYFRQPIIVDMLHVQALIYLITPFIALPTVLLARNLDFRSQAKADLAGAFAGAATALAGAWNGYGVWTLVVAPIVMLTVRAIGLGIAAGRLPFPVFSFSGLNGILGFGSALVLCQFFWVIQSQSDIFVAGRIFDPHDLGLYSEALFLTLIFTGKFIPPLNEVAFPAYTQLAKEGGDIGRAFLTTTRMLMFIAIPAFLGLSMVAGPFVDTVMGPKWHEMIPLVQGLPLAMPFFALQIICSPTTNAMGRPRIYVLSSLAGALIMPVAFLIGSQWGAMGLVHAWQVAAPVLLFVTLALTLPAIKVSAVELIKAIAPALAAALAMAAAVSLVERQIAGWPPALELLLLVILGGAIYGALTWTFARSTIAEIYTFITRRQLGQPISPVSSS
jgi:O-antigen/teichoic acid export membrane protein